MRSRIHIKDIILLFRPHQYIKNGFVFLPAFFGKRLLELEVLQQTLLAFVIFCLASSVVYIFNDIRDMEDDRNHPSKRFRPLASGSITLSTAIFLMGMLLLVTLGSALLFLPPYFFIILGLYLGINVLYSLGLKHIAVVDVVLVSIGFVFRVFAGAVVASVQASHWIVLMTFVLALFLSLAKRRDDLLLSEQGTQLRKSLDGYNMEFVSASMIVMSAVTLVSYLLYTVSPGVIAKHGPYLYLTAVWVVLGLLRYMQLTFVMEDSGSPTKIVIRDHFMKLVLAGWLITTYLLVYVFSP